MSDASTSNEVGKNNLYDNYNYTNGKPVTTFFPVDLDTKNLDKVNQDGTSGVVVVDETSAASINSDDIGKVGVVTLLVGSVPPEKIVSAKAKISEKAKNSGGIGLGEGGVVTLKQREQARKIGGREQSQ